MPATPLATPPEKSRHAASQAPCRAIGCADQAALRALRPDGVLVFKWNETHIKLAEILPLSPHPPLFGQAAAAVA